MPWKYFHGNADQPQGLTQPPERPPWRQFLPQDGISTVKDSQYWDRLRQLVAADVRSTNPHANSMEATKSK